MRRCPPLFLGVTVLLAACLPLTAQKFQPKTIQFKGDSEYSNQELLAAAGLQKGVVLNYSEMGDHSKQLMDTGIFESVAFKFDGWDLVFSLAPSPTMFPVRLENLPLSPGKDLDTKLHDRLPLYHGKVPSEGGLLEDVRKALEEMLASQGIKAAVVATPFAVMGSKKATAVSFSIAAPQVRVGSIHLEGVSPALQSQIKPVVNAATGMAFDTQNTESNLERAFEWFYSDEGYAAAKVHASRAGDPTVTADAVDIPFSVTVDEGRVYKLGSIHLPPEAPVTQADIDKIVGSRNNPAVKGLTLRTVWSMISARYKSKGLLDCKVTPHPEIDETSGTVNYNVDVDPGPVYHLAFVKFENVSDELRTKLMRSWQMLPGDIFDESYLFNFIMKAQESDPALRRTLAGLKVTYDVRADTETRDASVVIRLEKSL